MIKLNGNEISSIFYNGNEIVKVYYNNQVVYEKIKGMFINGTVSNTAYVPRVYVNSSAGSGSSPNGGTWVDTVLEGNTWKVDLSDRLPLTGMAFMFYIASSSSDRNRYIDKIVFPSNIDTSNVTSMYRMFYPASTSYTSLASIEGLENFDTSNVTNMGDMFYNCSKLESLDLSNWNTSKVTKMNYMFNNCSKLESLDLSNWNTSKVTTMNRMFYSCRALTSVEGIENLNTSNATDMSEMFRQCCLWNKLDLSNWNTSNVTNMSQMFGDGGGYGITDYLKTIDISGIDTSNVTTMSYMFSYRNKLTSIQGIESIDTSNVTTMSYMFFNCSSLTSIKLPITSNKLKNLNGMFSNCSNLVTVDLTNLNTSGVTDFAAMFQRCSKLENIIGIEDLDVSAAIKIGEFSNYGIFFGCSKLTILDLSKWNTANATDFQGTFTNCSNLTTLYLFQIGDGIKAVKTEYNPASDFDRKMFYNCSKLANIPSCGNIYNTVDFSYCPLTLTSAKVVLTALQAPYSGAQTLTFSSSTVNLIQQDQEALGLVAEKVALGWTINVALPDNLFSVNAGPVQDGLTVAQFPYGTQVTEYESGKYYQITACTADTVDFSGRDVKTALYLDYPSINTIDVSDNANLTKLVFNHENTNDMTIKFYNTGIDPDWAETFNDLASKNIDRSVTLYFGSQLNIGDYKYEADGPVEDAYVVFTFNADGTYTDDWYGCQKYEKVLNGIISFDDSINQWIPSTYAAPSDSPEISTMYMSDSNWHKGSQFAKCYFNVLPQTSDTNVDLYINSYGESGYDYTIAFSLDTDWTSTSNPSSTSTGVIAHTNGFSKDPSGSIATNYKKVSYTIPGDGQAHRILVIYRKDGSGDSYYDRGFVIAPYRMSWEPVPKPVKKVEITGTVTDTTYVPRVYVNSSYTGNVATETGGKWVDTVIDGNTWTVDLSDNLPLTGCAFMFYLQSSSSDRNRYVDKIVIPSNIDTSQVTSMNKMFARRTSANDSLTTIEGLEYLDTSNVTTMARMFFICSKLTTLYLPQIGDGNKSVDTSTMFASCASLTNITASGHIYNTVDLSPCPLTLASAKVVLNALQEPYSGAQSLKFSSSTMALILADPEAQSIAQEKAALGWTIA